jgi:V-type H+-transporting ATPase subunit C
MYWIVSVPYEESKVKTVKSIKQKMTEDKLCECYEFKIPKLKVGTLDQFDGLSDDLIKYDATVENITMKVLRTLGEVGEVSEADFNPEVILLDESTVPVSLYLNYFQWDENQYLLNKGLPETTELMYKKVLKIDDELKVKLGEYNTIKAQLQQLERKATGNLQVKSLDGIVRKEHIVDSEYLQTLFVAVPRALYKQWETTYEDIDEHISGYVVPQSSELIAEDNEYGLWSVVLIRKMAADFESTCRKNKFIVRQFEYDAQREELSKQDKIDIEKKKETVKSDLFVWCKMAFSECFSAWIHMKAIRVFVESVLRYGLPPRFCSVLLKVQKNEQKIHKYFKDTYKLQEELFEGVDEESLSAMGQFGNMEFHPYVLITVNTAGSSLLKL